MTLSGLLVVDKPVGPTSHDVVGRVRRAAGTRRVGHAGTLDPLAGGVLLVCVGQATRLVEYLVGLDKVYETTVRLGQSTTTYDAEGDVTAERPVAVSAEEIVAALDAFRGPIRQRVPPFSAVKRDGQPLYKKARRGEAIDLPDREVTIRILELLSYEPPLLTLRMDVSSGTYVRSLAHDLGQALGCGGHVVALRRTSVGRFNQVEAIALEELTPDALLSHLRPPAAVVAHLPRVAFDGEAVAELRFGRRLPVGVEAPAGDVAAFDFAGDLVGIVAIEAGEWRARKILAVTEED